MRILHVNKFLYRRGGAEAYMEDVAALQLRAGHDVTFFGMAHPQNTHHEWSRYYPSAVELDPPPADLASRGRSAARALWSSSARRGMAEVTRRFRPDVVHFHNIYHHLSPSVIGPAGAAGAATVLTLHDYKLACPSYLFLSQGRICEACLDGKFRHAIQRRCKGDSLAASTLLAVESGVHRRTHAYGGIQTFICPSRFMLTQMSRAGVFPQRLTVLPSFVDASGVLPRNGVGGPVVFASRLSAEKGADVAVAAMASLPEQVRLCVAGEGPQQTELVRLAERVAPGRVEFLGRIPKDEVARLISRASVVVAPSRCYENQPLTVLEAMAAGVPVVGSALGGIAEIVRPGVTGELVPPGDATALAAAIGRVLADPEAAEQMGHRARDAVLVDFSPDRHLVRLTALYESAVEDRRGAAHPSVPVSVGSGMEDRDV